MICVGWIRAKVALVSLLFGMQAPLALALPEGACSPGQASDSALGATVAHVEPLLEAEDFRILWSADATASSEIPHLPARGAELWVLRCLPPGTWVAIAEGIAYGDKGGASVGHVRSLGEGATPPGEKSHTRRTDQALARAMTTGNLYWRPMVGDRILAKAPKIRTVARISPRYSFGISELFEGSERKGYAYELSQNGRNLLREALQGFAGAPGKVLVEAQALRPGPRELVRSETQMRASIIARFLLDELGISHTSVLPVVPIGLGNDGLPAGLSPVPTWPQKVHLESVTLRVVPR